MTEHGSRTCRANDLGPPPESSEAAALRKIVTIYGRLSAIATERTDLSAVTRLLGQAVGAGVAVLSPTLELMAAAGQHESGRYVVEVLRSHAGQRGLGPVLAGVARARRAVTLPGSTDPASSVVVAPITAGDDLTAYLVTSATGEERFSDDVRLLLTEHAAMICGVVLGRERVVAAAAGEARRDLVEGVLQGRAHQDGEIDRWAGHLGFIEGSEYHVMAVRARPAKTEARRRPDSVAGLVSAAQAAIETFLVRHAPNSIVAVRGDEVVAIVPGPATGPLAYVKSLADRCRTDIEERHPDTLIAIGIGSHCRYAPQIAESYSQARRALETTERMSGGHGVLAFAELGVQRLLLKVPDVAELREFASEVLGAVLEHDASAGSQLLRTLSVFFRENCSPRRAASGLHVHPNTVSYRVRRIEELTGLSLEVHQDRLLAEVAAEILLPSREQ